MTGGRLPPVLAGSVALGLVVLAAVAFWDDGSEPAPAASGGPTHGPVVVVAPGVSRPAPGVHVPADDPLGLEASIRAAIPDGGVELGNVRIVDAGRRIACGERSVPGSAVLRRFVWLGQAGIVVTDDGGPDFANLVFVCDPSRAGAR